MVSFRCFPLLLLVACTRVHACTHTHTHTHAQLLQSCPTLCKSMDYSLPGSSVHGDSPDKNTGVGCHFLLQGDLPNPGIELAFPALQAESLPLNHQGRYTHTHTHTCILTEFICFPIIAAEPLQSQKQHEIAARM